MKKGGDDKEYLENYLCPHFRALHGNREAEGLFSY